MPPSGFSQKAVDGAVQFVRTCFEDLLTETRMGKHEDFKSAIIFEQGQTGGAPNRVDTEVHGFATVGSLQFIGSCYVDLYVELKVNPDATPEAAIEAVSERIRRKLSVLHIDARGNIVERDPEAPELVAARIDSFNNDA